MHIINARYKFLGKLADSDDIAVKYLHSEDQHVGTTMKGIGREVRKAP